MTNMAAMGPETIRRLSDEATKRLLNKEGTASSNLGGWMMIATILIEAWDLYAIAFVLIFVKADFNPTPFELGLATAAVQGGALSALCLAAYWRTISVASACLLQLWPCSSYWRLPRLSRATFGT
jgi:hypothetical protein